MTSGSMPRSLANWWTLINYLLVATAVVVARLSRALGSFSLGLFRQALVDLAADDGFNDG